MHGLGDQVQPDMQHGRATSATIELGFQWLQESSEYKRQRLQPLDGPFKIERLLETFLWSNGEKRPRILTARQALPPYALLSKPCSHGGGG